MTTEKLLWKYKFVSKNKQIVPNLYDKLIKFVELKKDDLLFKFGIS